jgi:anti-sigma B factor antagonist
MAVSAALGTLRRSLRPRGPVTFGVSERRDRRRTHLRLDGELDLLTAPKLAAAIDEILRHQDTDLAIDLRAVEFIDSAGLHVLLNAQRRLTRTGRSLAVISGPGPVRQVIELARLEDTLGVVGSPRGLR